MLPYLLDYFDGLYPQVLNHKPFLGKKFLQRVLLTLIYRINNFLCWYYHNVKKKRISSPEESQYIVSLTTYPARMSNLWRVIEMIANQRNLKDKYAIIVNLIESEFEGIELPKEIKELQDRGLTVRFHKENLRCHNKYYYTFRDYPNKTVITVDDDIQYNHHTITKLIETNVMFPNHVVYNWGNIIHRGSFMKFGSWPRYYEKYVSRFDVCPAGVGGVLYPPNSYSSRIFDIDTIRKTCLRADDLWLSFMERYANSKTVFSGLKATFMLLPDTNQSAALYLSNVAGEESGNDKQIKAISKWAETEFGCNFYVNIE